jgi:hypothetical protein
MVKGKHIQTITVTDPDSKLPVELAIFKLANGAVIGIDESFISNTDEDICNPYTKNSLLDLDI